TGLHVRGGSGSAPGSCDLLLWWYSRARSAYMSPATPVRLPASALSLAPYELPTPAIPSIARLPEVERRRIDRVHPARGRQVQRVVRQHDCVADRSRHRRHDALQSTHILDEVVARSVRRPWFLSEKCSLVYSASKRRGRYLSSMAKAPVWSCAHR